MYFKMRPDAYYFVTLYYTKMLTCSLLSQKCVLLIFFFENGFNMQMLEEVDSINNPKVTEPPLPVNIPFA